MLKRTILLENKTTVSTKNMQLVIKTETREVRFLRKILVIWSLTIRKFL